MKFSCEKLLLQNAVNTTSRAVAAKSSIPALEGLLLQCGDGVLTVSGYNMQTGIRTRFPVEEQEGGELVLSARLFGDIIRRMPDDMITFSSDEKLMVHLSCGDADFDILALSAADFPELPEVEEKYSVSLPEKTLRSMIQQTSFAVSTNEARPVHMGELFEIGDNGLTVVAVDGFRLALRREPLERIEGGEFLEKLQDCYALYGRDETIVVPRSCASSLSSIENSGEPLHSQCTVLLPSL